MKISLDELIVLLPKEKNNAITAHTLSKLANVCETYIRKKINEARAIGIPICSLQRGYYLSYECDDIAKTIKFLTNRLNTQIKAINGLKERNAKGERKQ